MTHTVFDLPSALLEAGAVRLSPDSPFVWASGLKSPIYCDNRQLLGFPIVRSAVADALAASVSALARGPGMKSGVRANERIKPKA